ncbi:MAG: glycosyltransferase family 9 protein [Thermodesulfobacteriota bacterium]
MPSPLPPPKTVQRLLIWHQGALGDLLLAGPALLAISRHYPQARLVGVGHPERWGLFSETLPLEAIWDGAGALWAGLFLEQGPLSPALKERLASIQLALVFTPRPNPVFLDRLAQGGISRVAWLPSFPETEPVAVGLLQARHLAELGITKAIQPFRLGIEDSSGKEDLPAMPPGPYVAVAPGSGYPCKNWPLAHYYELTRALAWQYKAGVIWLVGPAETGWLPYLQGIAAAQGHYLLVNRPLMQLAGVLARCRLYVGGDSGLTHLAAAAGARAVLALFGPTDPAVWAPQGENVTVLTGPGQCLPCAQARDISCPAPRCLEDLSPPQVFKAAGALMRDS